MAIPSAARLPTNGSRFLGPVLLLSAACVLPFWLNDYRVLQLTLVLVYAIALLGLNMLTGYTGQISLGHGAFYALGAYVAAVLMGRFGTPYWLTAPLAGGACLVAGFLFGLPALRLEGIYLALATFALGVAMPQVLKYRGFEHWTGGTMGLVVAKPDPPAWVALDSDRWLYFLVLSWLVLLLVVSWNIVRGRLGRAMVAIRDHPIAAEAMGVNTSLVKTMTFGLSAMYAGIAGALGAIVVQFVAPDSFTVFLSISLLVGLVIGGLASVAGAIYGALFIQFIPNLSDEISKAAPWAIYGVFLIGFTVLMPTGVAGFVRMLATRVRRHSARPSTAVKERS